MGWPYLFIRTDGRALRDIALNDVHARQKAHAFGATTVFDAVDGRLVWSREGA